MVPERSRWTFDMLSTYPKHHLIVFSKVSVMCTIDTFSQTMKIIKRSLYQCFFLFSTPTLYLFFSFVRYINSMKLFKIYEFNRQALECMICTNSGIMLPYSQIKVVGASCIVTVIRTLQYVHPSFHVFVIIQYKLFRFCWQ